MRVYKSDGTYVDDPKDTEFGWYFSEIAVDEGYEHFEEYNKHTKGLSRLRKSLTKENLLESIDLPLYPTRTTPSSATQVQVPMIKTKPNNSATITYENCIKNVDCGVPSREELAAMINPCNIESKMLLSVVHNAKYKSLIKEENTEGLLKTVNFKTTGPKCLINERKESLTEDMYNEIRNYHATKEENMMSLMMELILADVDCKLDDLIDVPKLEKNELPTESPNSITTTSDLGNSIHSSNSSRETHTQDGDNLTVSSRSHIVSSIGLSEEYKSIQDFCSETYEMHLKLAEIRRSFQDSETKVDKLLKQAAELDKDLRETMYLDDILHLMTNDLEKVQLKKLPFRIFHQSEPEDSELNFIV